MSPTIQSPAPVFSVTALIDGAFKEVSLADYLGQWWLFTRFPRLAISLTCPSQGDPDVLPSVRMFQNSSRAIHLTRPPLFFSSDCTSDFTFVCPTEILAFNDALPEFARLNTTVLGTSSSHLEPLMKSLITAHTWQPYRLTRSTRTTRGRSKRAALAGSGPTCRFRCSRTATCA
jgi:hypothetical protein